MASLDVASEFDSRTTLVQYYCPGLSQNDIEQGEKVFVASDNLRIILLTECTDEPDENVVRRGVTRGDRWEGSGTFILSKFGLPNENSTLAIRNHQKNSQELYLYQRKADKYVYRGNFTYIGDRKVSGNEQGHEELEFKLQLPIKQKLSEYIPKKTPVKEKEVDINALIQIASSNATKESIESVSEIADTLETPITKKKPKKTKKTKGNTPKSKPKSYGDSTPIRSGISIEWRDYAKY